MRKILALVVAAVVLIPAIASANEVDFAFGQKRMDSHDWDPVENQIELGVQSTLGPPRWPVQIAADGFYSTQSSRGVTASTLELCGGVRKIFRTGDLRPYLGGGLGFVHASVSGGGNSDDDTELGLWLGGGAFVRVGRNVHLGAGLRYSTATVH